MDLNNFDHFRSFCAGAASSGVLFYYSGHFSGNVVGTLSDTVRERLESIGAPNQARRKVFATFIEMAQNILHYSATRVPAPGDSPIDSRIGALAVGHDGQRFHVLCGNPVRTDHIERLRGKIEPLRHMPREDIKAAYREQLRNDAHDREDTLSRGAGLGFLTMAREASEPIDYQIVFRADDAEHADFYLRAII